MTEVGGRIQEKGRGGRKEDGKRNRVEEGERRMGKGIG
jgi:hypothetical protein